MKTILYFGREIFEPKIYSKIFTVDQSTPTPAGDKTLVIVGEATSGVKFGLPTQVSSTLSENKALFGDRNPLIQAIAHALTPSGEVEAAQHILVYNVRALVQASGVILTSSGGADSITAKSRIYGINGNSVKISKVTASGVVTVTVESSWIPTTEKIIDNPILTVSGPATSTLTVDATQLTIFDGTNTVNFKFVDYPTIGSLIQAIKDSVTSSVAGSLSGVTITKDVTTSDNENTLNLLDFLTAQDIATDYIAKGDLKQFFDFLDQEITDIEVTRESTATVLPDDFTLQLANGSAGSDPTATDWTNILAELESTKFGALVPVLDGLAAPYDVTLTKAVNALIATHAVNMAAVEKRGKKREVYLPHYGGTGYSGVKVVAPTVDVSVTDSASYNSEYSQFIGFALDDRDVDGLEQSFIPSYYAVKLASMAMGGPASRVLSNIGINCVKATNDFKESDRLKLHKASIVFPHTDEKGTYTHMSYTTWKSDNDPMKTIPSRVRCAMLSDNDVARKLESEKLKWNKSGFSPYSAKISAFIKKVLDSHKKSSVNWLDSYGEVKVTISGNTFSYDISDLIVPTIPEIGLGKTTFVST